MSATEIFGVCPERYAKVRAAFADNFDRGEELGARFCLVEAGQLVVDLWAGHADRARTRPFDDETVSPIFSTTKAVAALLIARSVAAGRLDYDARVTDLWPEFGQAGKAEITLGQVMSHQAGLCGFPDPMDPALWYDWDAICAKLAAMAPIWPPGTASGYHPVTLGYIAGELFRRAEGRTMGQALREDLTGPFELDLWIGLPDSEEHRLTEIIRPRTLTNFGHVNAATTAAFLTPWAQPGGRDPAAIRRVEIPTANGHATAQALARLFGALADDGWLDGEDILTPPLIAELTRERIRGQDLVLPFEISWAAGVMRNETIKIWGPGLQTFGHAGWGGSCVFVDPERRLAGAYVMNRQSAELIGDMRSRRLIDAIYA